MLTWAQLREVRPDLSEAGRQHLYRVGVGLAFLSTVRRDGGPRVHPVCPLLTEDSVFAFIVPSPKQQDLVRDGRYAMHSFPRPDDEDAFYISGSARRVDDAVLRAELSDQFVEERVAHHVPAPAGHDVLFEFLIERGLVTRTTGHGDPNPVHTVWRAS